MVEKSEVTHSGERLGTAVLPGSGEPTHASLRPQRQPGKAESCCPAEQSGGRWRPPELSSVAYYSPSCSRFLLVSRPPIRRYVTTGERPPGICQWHRNWIGRRWGDQTFAKEQQKNAANCNIVSVTPDAIPIKPVQVNLYWGWCSSLDLNVKCINLFIYCREWSISLWYSDSVKTWRETGWWFAPPGDHIAQLRFSIYFNSIDPASV